MLPYGAARRAVLPLALGLTCGLGAAEAHADTLPLRIDYEAAVSSDGSYVASVCP